MAITEQLCCFPCKWEGNFYLVSWPLLIVIPLSLKIAPMVLVSLVWSWVTLFCFPIIIFVLNFTAYNIFFFIPELSHHWNTIIWHLSWLTLVSQLTHRVAWCIHSHWELAKTEAQVGKDWSSGSQLVSGNCAGTSDQLSWKWRQQTSKSAMFLASLRWLNEVLDRSSSYYTAQWYMLNTNISQECFCYTHNNINED
jgi:hypothetical protein